MHVTRRLPIRFALLLILAGCGGGTPAATDAGGEAGTDATPTAATDGGGDVAATAPPAGGGNGSSIDDFCLVTADEVSAAFEIDVEATSYENPGLGGGCTYVTADNASGFALSVITSRGIPAFEANFQQGEGAEAVSGTGDEAYYRLTESEEGDGRFGFAFRKGDIVVSMAPVGFDVLLDGDHERLRAATEELALMAAGRL